MTVVKELLISQSKKELENFIQVKFEDYKLGRASQKSLRAVVEMIPWDSDGKESACNVGGLGSIPGSGRSPGEGNGNQL